MPEGDTIHRAVFAVARPCSNASRSLRSRCRAGAARSRDPGETIDAVRTIGKHLVVDFSGGLSLRVHLRMTGRWRVYARGEISDALGPRRAC